MQELSMSFNVIPLWKSHFSLGRSILKLDKPGGPAQPVSIFDVLLEEKHDTLTLVEDNVSGFLEANKQCKANKIRFIFGLRITIVNDMNAKSEESLKEIAKYIVFVKNTDGYKNLIKIWSVAAKDGFYYEPRIDFKTLKALWNEKNLKLAVPFYDSFLFSNALDGHVHVPDFSFTNPTFFIESHNLPFDDIVEKRVKSYCGKGNYRTSPASSIYYKSKQDFLAYMTFRCISNRTTIEKPELNHFSSDTFSFEHWKKMESQYGQRATSPVE